MSISKISIKGLWHRFDIEWELTPHVNILAGVNGIGKSTIINLVVAHLKGKSLDSAENVEVFLNGEDADFMPNASGKADLNFDLIRSFDRPLLPAEQLRMISDERVVTEQDWKLFKLQRQYLDYQVNIGNKTIEYLQSNDASVRDKAYEVSKHKALFQDLVDDLFSLTGKKLDRSSNEIRFIQDGDLLTPYKLGSGEKQMLLILMTSLLQNREPFTLFMDEPEASLHIEWQQRLIDLVLKLNPSVQIILSTHSPALIMEGWMSSVTEVSDIASDSRIMNNIMEG